MRYNIIVRVAGVTYDNRQQLLADLAAQAQDPEDDHIQLVQLIPEPDNAHDPNAIKVMRGADHLGYIPREHTETVRELLAWPDTIAHISEITGGTPGYPTYGAKVFIGRDLPAYSAPYVSDMFGNMNDSGEGHDLIDTFGDQP